ncbi:MAG: FAD-dependent monooxygenase [Bryobacterales bacterium]|nr:FAD-dependent monooxygenase [Bryobacterales bacterium]
MQDPQVLVAGAGPVGQFAALALARRGVPVEIADTGIWPCKHSYALALHPQTIRLLEGYGLQEEILAEAYPVRTIGLYDKSGRRGASRWAIRPIPRRAWPSCARTSSKICSNGSWRPATSRSNGVMKWQSSLPMPAPSRCS